MPGDVAGQASATPIGRALPSLQVTFMDLSSARPLGPGTVGGIAISGSGVALSDVANPVETARRFVELRLDGGTRRYFRTGDLARLGPS